MSAPRSTTRAPKNGHHGDDQGPPLKGVSTAHIYTYARSGASNHFSPELASAVQTFEKHLEMPVWLLVQSGLGRGSYLLIDDDLVDLFYEARSELPVDERVALLIDSPGGSPKAAFKLAMFLRRHCGGFVAVVPRYAKSAATLLALGADNIWLGRCAELGPLDAQVMSSDGGAMLRSALDEVQTLENVHREALRAVHRTVAFLIEAYPGYARSVDAVLPLAFQFVADLMKPVVEHIEVVSYTQRTRTLRVAEQYAMRLMAPLLPNRADALAIATGLVGDYPDHGFAIDIDEASGLGLNVVRPTPQNKPMFDTMDMALPHLKGLTAIGRVQERKQA